MSAGLDGSTLSGNEKERYVAEMFDRIAGPYDRLNRAISLGQDKRWRRRALDLAKVPKPATEAYRALDLGCGTGDLFVELHQRLGEAAEIQGIDLCNNMLDVAREKARRSGLEGCSLEQGRAEDTGLEAESLDLVTMGWVLRNVGDRPATYREILKILKPGGHYVCIDMSHPESGLARAGSSLYLKTAMPVLIRVLGGDAEAYRYLERSTQRFPGRRALEQELDEAGFDEIKSLPLMMGSIAIHVGRRPCR